MFVGVSVLLRIGEDLPWEPEGFSGAGQVAGKAGFTRLHIPIFRIRWSFP